MPSSREENSSTEPESAHSLDPTTMRSPGLSFTKTGENTLSICIPNPFSSLGACEELTLSFNQADLSGMLTPSAQAGKFQYPPELDDQQLAGNSSLTLPPAVIGVKSPPFRPSPSPSRVLSPSSFSSTSTGSPNTNAAFRTRTLEGNKVINEYVFMEELGRGTFGKVKLCYSAVTGHYYAIKIYNKQKLKRHCFGNDNGLEKVQSEIDNLTKLQHPNIIRLQEVIDDPEKQKLYLVLEFAQQGALVNLDRLGNVLPDDYGNTKIPPTELRRIARSLLSAVCFAHSHEIAHRDIKPDNILLTGTNDVKLADFGGSAFVRSRTSVANLHGTIAYLPPEALRGAFEYDLFKADVWALGVTLFVLLEGVMPFRASDRRSLLAAQMSETPKVSVPSEGGFGIGSFIERCLDTNPETRADTTELAEHPWITNNGGSPLKVQPVEEFPATVHSCAAPQEPLVLSDESN